MIDSRLEESGDRIIIKLDPGGFIELNDLTESFAALARYYERHYRREGEDAPAPKLFVSRMETGSIVAEIVPLVTIIGAAVYTMDSGIIVADFTRRLWSGIKAFSAVDMPPSERPSRDDARDLQTFVAPLTGRPDALLGIKHARLEVRDGERITLAEYLFDEAELNRAAINMERALELPEPPPVAAESRQTSFPEVMLFFQQASRAPGKVQGRTGDKAVVPDVSERPLPVYFRKSITDLKDQMVKGRDNPLTNAFVVDVHVQYLGDEPKGYIVTDVHDVLPLEDDAP